MNSDPAYVTISGGMSSEFAGRYLDRETIEPAVNMMKPTKIRTALGSVSLALLLTVSLGAQQDPSSSQIRLASDVWPPFTDVLGNTRIAIELVNEALGRANQDVRVYIRDDFGALMGEIISGKFDGSAALWLSPEREGFLRFSHPYLENRLILVGRKGSDVSAVDFEALKDRRVAIVGNYAYGLTSEAGVGPIWVNGKSDQENLKSLLEGKVNYILADEFLIEHLLEKQGEKAKQSLQVGSIPLLKRSLHFAIRRDVPGSAEIIGRFNEEIREMISDGTYNRILQLNWIRADVDGDGLLELVLGSTNAGLNAPEDGYDVFVTEGQTTEAPANSHYWVDGRLYNSWDTVPDRYKTAPTTISSPSLTGGGMLNLDF